MNVLNLYAGIGGNRKLWTNCEITAVELNPDIAAVYQEFYPDDIVVVADAHQYLLEHYKEFDFIWSSPPCPSHSEIRRCGVHRGQYEAIYPDMALYQEIILLMNFFKGYFVLENVKPYYEPLINAIERGRHLLWSNFYITEFSKKDSRTVHCNISSGSSVYGRDLRGKKTGKRKDMVLRNQVNPELGLHIWNCYLKASITKPEYGIKTSDPAQTVMNI